MTSCRSLRGAALAGAMLLGALGTSVGTAAVAAADNTVPPSMLNTT